jgi:hypothetical protein
MQSPTLSTIVFLCVSYLLAMAFYTLSYLLLLITLFDIFKHFLRHHMI